MRLLPTASLLAISLFCMSFGYYSLNTYEISEDYAIKFSTRGVEGTFSDLNGSIAFDASNLATSSFDVAVATSTIETGNNTQNKHARGDNWLSVHSFHFQKQGLRRSDQRTERSLRHRRTVSFWQHGR